VIYDAVFRNLFNTGLGLYAGAGLPNDVSLTSFLPPGLRDALSRNVVSLFGLSPGDEYLQQFLAPAGGSAGASVPSGCVVRALLVGFGTPRVSSNWPVNVMIWFVCFCLGSVSRLPPVSPCHQHPITPQAPIYSLEVNGGSCEVQDDGSVECEPPFVALTATPLTCNLAFTSAGGLTGQSFRYSRAFGEARGGFIGPPPGLYSFGATYNLTRCVLDGDRGLGWVGAICCGS